MELLQGARSKQEIKIIKSFLAEFAFRVIPLTENTGHRALVYMEEYGLKAGMCLADALIAASAVENHLTLLTGNHKHYKAVNELDVKTFRP
jgi:predicted nucleic acid-binding protein